MTVASLVRSLVVTVVAVVAMLPFTPWPASADVSERGAFTSSVRIDVPAFYGIEPAISLVYDSARPNGLVGVGWGLEAASYITRAGRQGGAPRVEPGDVFMLDGEQLVECAPSCPSGGTHETRKRDFTRITFHDGRWTRWRRDGVRFEYEPLPLANSRGTYRWALERVIDTHGNTVVYEHGCDGVDCYLDWIAYADGRDGATGARIRFHYGGRFDPVSYGTGATLRSRSRS